MSKVTEGFTNWSSVVLAYFSLFALGLLDNIRSPFFSDLAEDLHLSDLQASLFFAVTSIVAFLAGLFVPYLLGRWRIRSLLRVALIFLTVAFVLNSQSPNLSVLLVGSAIFGLAFGVINVAQNLLIMENASSHWRRRLLNGLHGMYALAALTAPLVAAYFLKVQWQWRWAFFILAFVGVGGFLISLVGSERTQARRSEKSELTLFPPNMGQYLHVGVMLSLYIIAEVLLSTRLPLYMRRVYALNSEDSAIYLALFFFFLFIGRLLFLLVDFNWRNIKIIEGALLFSLGLNVLGLTVHPFFLALCGLAMAPIFGLSIDYIASKYSERANDAVSVCVTLSGLFLVLMHYSMGAVTEFYGIEAAMYFGCIGLLLAWVLLRTLECQPKRALDRSY